MLPAWANEPAQARDYSGFEGEDARPQERFERGGSGGRQRPRPAPSRDGKSRRTQGGEPRAAGRPREDVREPMRIALPPIAVRFFPHQPALESVIAQIKSGPVAYSVFALARLFLDKPERYDVQLSAPEGAELHQLGQTGPVAADRRLLENGAFAAMKDEFYTIEVVQTEPIKGNFTNVARCRLSGSLLGPTNHHAYQPQLRTLYEQRFSRRMSFADYQRQIEIVNDPAVIEQWKEQARTVTTFTTRNEDPPITFNSAADAERHFRQQYLPGLLRTAREMKISGVISRRFPDRGLGRLVEDAWSHEVRSPSRMMQELVGGLRHAGLHILRHRRGMLYVLPIRARNFGHERAGVSASINAILEKLAAVPGTNRKQLAQQLVPAEGEAAEIERGKLALAADLRWLIREGYVIEFNDGTLDLPRVKMPAATSAPADPRPPSDDAPAEEAPETFPAEVETDSIDPPSDPAPATSDPDPVPL